MSIKPEMSPVLARGFSDSCRVGRIEALRGFTPDIILVDRDHLSATRTSRALGLDGAFVEIFEKAEEALERSHRQTPDLAIFGLEFETMSGFEAASIFRRDLSTRHIPLLVLSSHDDAQSRAAAFSVGADCFLAKPCEDDELLAAVRSLGRRGRQLRYMEREEDVLLALAEVGGLGCLGMRGHLERTSRLARQFGRLLGLQTEDLLTLERAGLLHDIGKAGLLKEPASEEIDRVAARQHPLLSIRICSHLHTMQSVVPVIRHHHERWDGEGYPDGLKGTEIPYLARILQLADSFDALVSRNRDGGAYSAKWVLNHMAEERETGRWDPELVEAFVSFGGARLFN